MKINFTDEMIKENYGEIIEGLILNYYFDDISEISENKNEKEAISFIRKILECGGDSFDYDKMEDVCDKFFFLSDHASYIESLTEEYYGKNFGGVDDYFLIKLAIIFSEMNEINLTLNDDDIESEVDLDKEVNVKFLSKILDHIEDFEISGYYKIRR